MSKYELSKMSFKNPASLICTTAVASCRKGPSEVGGSVTSQTVSVEFSLAGSKKSYLLHHEKGHQKRVSIRSSSINERSILCNINLKYQMRKKKSNKMKERKKVPIHYFFFV